MQLRWRSSSAASAFWAGSQIVAGNPAVFTELASTLTAPATALHQALETAGLGNDVAWRWLLALGWQVGNPRELAELVVRKSRGAANLRPPAVELISGRIRDLVQAFAGWMPDAATALSLRERPLREQWEARGPGMLKIVGDLTDADLIAAEADLVLVHPALGGGGTANLATNSVLFEAMLTNPPMGPVEAVRLAWLLAQLQCELPKYADQVNTRRLPVLAGFALVIPTLVAAEAVELAPSGQAATAAALSAWRLPAADTDESAGILCDWWQTYQESRPAWAVALAALDRMLPETAGAAPAGAG